MSDWTDEEVIQHLGPPRLTPVGRYDGLPLTPHAPSYVVHPYPINNIIPLCHPTLRLVDFGESFRLSSPPDSLHTPRALSAPEILWPEKKEQPFSPALDVWAMAGTMFEIFGDHALFSSVLGFEKEIREKIQLSMSNNKEKLKTSLQDLVIGTPETDSTCVLNKDELATMVNIWMRCFEMDPHDRITAGAVPNLLPEMWKGNIGITRN
jgi:serine/threonine protein kinase